MGWFADVATRLFLYLLFVSAQYASVSLMQAQAISHATSTPRVLQLGSQSLSYTATTGFIEVSGTTSGSRAKVFFTAYTEVPQIESSHRPIIFAYNGGPGGSSAGVHIGAFGPRVLPPLNPKSSTRLTGELTNNPDSLLDVGDIVFLDPVGSGFSKLLPGTEPSAFYGVQQDAEATANFINNYLRAVGRRESPTYLLGKVTERCGPS